ncbi:hypothetical protein GCM10022381_41630 [Leifsonia kafniensis]|uniref:Ricin B lectin domain-containing protein n=1 Tax=Leifsonia kafniensis TaxID=475957 RepID=A0ABP7L7P1_9MICO
MNHVRWRSNLEARLLVRGDDRGVALLTALMFMIFATGLSLVLLSAILSQAVPAYTAQKNTRTVYAAQAGLQSALALIRSADAAPDAAGNVYGVPAELPCSAAGNVTADTKGASYLVTLQYFTADPTSRDAAWRASNKMDCPVATVPKYAYVESSGQDAAIPGNSNATVGNRALSAIYKFKTTNANIIGGMIYNSNSSYCMEAVAKTAGSEMKFVPAAQCQATPLQLWIYATDYELKLASTVAVGSVSMCITGPVADTESTQKALLQPCQTNDTRWNQLWSWVGGGTWAGQQKIIANGPGTYCLQTSSADGSNLSSKRLEVKKSCAVGTFPNYSYQPTGTFNPSLSVGAGAAGYDTHQIVNYQEFGRCADVTAEEDTTAYMIVYPCKQDPTALGTYLKWNHKWYYTKPPEGSTTLGPQPIYIDNNKTSTTVRKCLTSPAVGDVDVTFTLCNSSLDRQKWTRVENTGDYSSSYLFVNSEGKCLTADMSSLHDSKWSKVRVANCNGSLAQKWNAPPTYVDATFGGYREVAP